MYIKYHTRCIMNQFKYPKEKKKSLTQEQDALKIVREFQRKYRKTIPDKGHLDYTWEANPTAAGQLKQKNYIEDFQLI